VTRPFARWLESPGAAWLLAAFFAVCALAYVPGWLTREWVAILDIFLVFYWAQEAGRRSERKLNSEAADLRAALDRMHLDGDR